MITLTYKMHIPEFSGPVINYFEELHNVTGPFIAKGVKEHFGKDAGWSQPDLETVVVWFEAEDEWALNDEDRVVHIEEHRPGRCGYFLQLRIAKLEVTFPE